MSGWIKLHRKFLDWEWYSDINVMRVFSHLLLKVNYEDKKWHGKIINAGQLITSYANLGSECSLSVQQVRTALDKLKSTSEITSQSTNNYTLITVCNWNIYQQDNTPDNKRITNEQQTDNKRITTTKEDKNLRTKESCEVSTRGRDDFQKVYQLGSSLFPRLATANSSEIAKWLENGCDVEKDILPELERQSGKQIGAWRYFTEPIAQAKANRLQPMPELKPQKGNKNATSKWASAAADYIEKHSQPE